jgi:hypothetical protein
MPSVGGFAQTLLLDDIFGPAIACVHTAISAGATAQTSIATGTVASGGTTAGSDTTCPSNGIVLVVHPGSGASFNQYSIVQAFVVTSASSTALTIASQTINFAISVGDYIFYLGKTTQTGPIFLANLYLALSTATWSATVTDATLYGAEPTATGGYARLAIPSSTTNWPNATGPSSGVSTIENNVAQSMATSTGAWSTGTTPLASVFFADTSTLGGGNVIWSGALTPATDICNGTGVTFSFAIDALKQTIQ